MNKFLDRWNELARKLDTSLVDNIASTTPWLAPVIPAYLAYHNTTTVMGFPAWVAFIGAVVVECLGLATVTTSFQFWDWNDKKRQVDQSAPFWIALTTAAFYLAIVLTVNVLLDGAPLLHRIAKLLLSVLGVVGAITLAIRSQHSRRLAAVEDEKAAKRQERQEKRQQTASTRQVAAKVPDWRALSEEERDAMRGLSSKQICERYPGLSDRTARYWKSQLKISDIPY
jgi:hypothetical protein